jgi:hypothetical protein
MAAAAEDWLTIGGDYRFRYDVLQGKVHDYRQSDGTLNGVPAPGYTVKNNSLMMNRFGLNLKADPMEDIVVKARLVMYKVAGHQTADPALGVFFADRFGGSNDGTVSHIPQDSVVRVDYAFATVNNVFDQPIWFSIGRRPSTGGIPSNYRQNQEKMGTAGIPAILVDYAFDGVTLGYAPDIAKLPGAYAKLCYGRGYESGFKNIAGSVTGSSSNLKDTDFLGLNAVAYDTEKLHVEVQYQKGMNIFDQPSDTPPMANLGDIEWVGGVITTKMGSLNLFASAAVSKTDPNGNTFMNGGQASLLNNGSSTESHTGNALYVGGRLDMGSTKIGAEYNQGSKYWIGMIPDSDDIWTGKLGTRGSVYEVYLIQELKRKPISKKGKAFVRLGYQYYDFQYSGSNNWVGAPQKIADMSTTNIPLQQMLAPLKNAQDLYATFDCARREGHLPLPFLFILRLNSNGLALSILKLFFPSRFSTYSLDMAH